MSNNEHAKLATAYLEELCDQLDRTKRLARPRQQWWKLPALLPATVGLVVGVSACGSTVDDDRKDKTEVCDNGIDDDGNGDIDCADEACWGDYGCGGGMMYAGPADEICDNGIDDNYNNAIDCADEACWDFPGCSGEEYAAPVEICDNQIDDDGDEKVDCDDEDCVDFPGCDNSLYAAP